MTDKHVEGWDDPRMPTISGLRRRGYTAASIREFCKRIGVTSRTTPLRWRRWNPASVKISTKCAARNGGYRSGETGYRNYQGEGEMVTMPNHPNKPEMGSRQVPFSGEIWIDRADFREEATSSTNVWCWVKKCVCVMLM